jgi:hypothetical protein
MARSDLLISLVKAGSSGDTARARSVTEAIIAEERAKRHNVLAERLSDALQLNGSSAGGATFIGPSRQHRQFLIELTPRKRLADLVLTDLARRTCVELIEEQHRASVLRAHALEPPIASCSSARRGTGRPPLPRRSRRRWRHRSSSCGTRP